MGREACDRKVARHARTAASSSESEDSCQHTSTVNRTMVNRRRMSLRQAGASEASSLHTERRRRAGGATRTAAPMLLGLPFAWSWVSRLRCSSARKLRFRAVLPAPVALAGLPAEHPDWLCTNWLETGRPGRLRQRTYPRVQPAPARLCVIVFELGCRWCAQALLRQLAFMSARRTLRATLAPTSWHTLDRLLERKGSRCEHAGRRTCSPLVAKWVEATSASARKKMQITCTFDGRQAVRPGGPVGGGGDGVDDRAHPQAVKPQREGAARAVAAWAGSPVAARSLGMRELQRRPVNQKTHASTPLQ